MLERPETSQPHYGEHLGDVAYWGPYVREVVRRHDLPEARVAAGFVGTFPTFLVGDVVVKLFGPLYDGVECFEVECAVHEAIAEHPAIPAPEIVGCGALFEDEHMWPYLVQERIGGIALREAELDASERSSIAAALALAVRAVHELPAPSFRPSLLDDLRRRCHPSLPEHLQVDVDEYLADALPADTFVHGDITADHVFVDANGLVGIIDWGDALPADRYYDLIPIFFDAFARDRSAAQAFLDAYGWSVESDFTRRLVQAALEFQFDPFRDLELSGLTTLDGLPERLWTR